MNFFDFFLFSCESALLPMKAVVLSGIFYKIYWQVTINIVVALASGVAEDAAGHPP